MSAIIFLVLRIILVVLLYAFLGFVLYTIWRDIKQQSQLIAARQPSPLTLTCLDYNLSPSKHFTCTEVILGRESTCDFSLEDQTVSARHARLSYHQNQWWLEDLASTNGTYLNGEKVTAPVVVTQGDELRLGQILVNIAVGEL